MKLPIRIYRIWIDTRFCIIVLNQFVHRNKRLHLILSNIFSASISSSKWKINKGFICNIMWHCQKLNAWLFANVNIIYTFSTNEILKCLQKICATTIQRTVCQQHGVKTIIVIKEYRITSWFISLNEQQS